MNIISIITVNQFTYGKRFSDSTSQFFVSHLITESSRNAPINTLITFYVSGTLYRDSNFDSIIEPKAAASFGITLLHVANCFNYNDQDSYISSEEFYQMKSFLKVSCNKRSSFRTAHGVFSFGKKHHHVKLFNNAWY